MNCLVMLKVIRSQVTYHASGSEINEFVSIEEIFNYGHIKYLLYNDIKVIKHGLKIIMEIHGWPNLLKVIHMQCTKIMLIF